MGQESEKSNKSFSTIEERKEDHIRICLDNKVQSKDMSTGFKDILLVHKALPEIDRDKIDLSTYVFSHRFSAPIIIESLSGGTKKSSRINSSIAQSIEELGLGMGVGSQRIALENPKLEKTFSIARKKAPTAFIMANIGAPQIIKDKKCKKAKKVVEMIQADALTIHLNALQESIQPEGETNYTGLLEKIKEIAGSIDVPLVIKETGAGISAEDAYGLADAGVSAIDVGGAGGTSWAAVEYFRAREHDKIGGQNLGETFWDWGIPTAVSLIEVLQLTKLPVISSGGIRSGTDIAKSLTLGANLSGFASPALYYAIKGHKYLKDYLSWFAYLLAVSLLLISGVNSYSSDLILQLLLKH